MIMILVLLFMTTFWCIETGLLSKVGDYSMQHKGNKGLLQY
jgi:hypothetical protein